MPTEPVINKGTGSTQSIASVPATPSASLTPSEPTTHCASLIHPAHDTRTVQVPLYRLAHSRTGDKGNISNISVIAWSPACYPHLLEHLTETAVALWFAHRQPGKVQRYTLDGIHALNFVLHDVLDGGVNDALNLDTHGKALSFHLLDMLIPVPAGLATTLPDLPLNP